MDPPFNVGTTFRARRGGPHAYEDRWPSLDAYLGWLEPRLRASFSLLAPEGTLWLHLDHRAVHEAKVLCDRMGRYAGEIIWIPGNGGKRRRGPSITHQTLLIYALGDRFVWNAHDPMLREPYAKTSLAMHFAARDAEGRAFRDRTINGKTYRYYADQGRAIGSVWSDCPAMSANTPLRRETTGYPTQKPLKLLERIVRAATSPGGRVVDPFCGSGTTLVAAASLGRAFAGADVGELAIATTTNRLEAAGVSFRAITEACSTPSSSRSKGARSSSSARARSLSARPSTS
jgi:site-specific DNA-methyltransferase (adenine-specific)